MNLFGQSVPPDGWYRIGRTLSSVYLDSVKNSEYFALGLFSRLAPYSRMKSGVEAFADFRDGRLRSSVTAGADGVIAPILSPGSRLDGIGYLLNKRLAPGQKHLTVMGPEPSVMMLCRLLNAKCASVSYRLMKAAPAMLAAAASAPCSGWVSGNGISVKTATVKDAEKLFHLRKAYELEEVILDPSAFNEKACYRRFRHILETQYFLYAEMNGEPVATCGTNASGLAWRQIGGVYTRPELRGRGLSFLLMKKMAESSLEAGTGLSLFVKPQNKGAVRLYEKCGFADNGDFRISYLERI